MKQNHTIEQRGQRLYVVEAALEYLIALLVAGSFLATITKAIGIPDSLTGILSAVISLGCLFQLLSVFIRPFRAKGFVIVFSVLNQLLFMALYIIPLLNIPSVAKTYIFIACIVIAYLLYYLAHPRKISWLMDLVADEKRGRFTANKEIISLVLGMGFSYGMGFICDHFIDQGHTDTAFIISAVVIFFITIAHTVTMLFTPEKESQATRTPPRKLSVNIKETFSDKSVLCITGVFVLYYIAKGFCVPFYGTYMISELDLNLTTVSMLSIFSSVVRIAASGFLGRYADKNSFASMIQICFIALAAAFLCASFAVPSNGLVMFALYYAFHGFSLAGINSSLTNMIFDYVPHEKRADSLAVCQAAAGFVGFLTTLGAGVLLAHIQDSGNVFMGLPLYAQQVVSFIGVIVSVIAIVYIQKIVMKKCRKSV